jgi:hypothetical protein
MPIPAAVTPPGPQCPYCSGGMAVTRMHCEACAVSIEGAFSSSRLARLPAEHQRFIELFVLSGGSLKEIAERAGVSYPTVRSRLDRVIAALRDEVVRDGAGSESESQAARTIKAI